MNIAGRAEFFIAVPFGNIEQNLTYILPAHGVERPNAVLYARSFNQ